MAPPTSTGSCRFPDGAQAFAELGLTTFDDLFNFLSLPRTGEADLRGLQGRVQDVVDPD
jgi:hypothetical protein